ncbi:MAG: hypothetical protein NVS9B4_10490 [Candidatus Acidiferrum sp.]
MKRLALLMLVLVGCVVPGAKAQEKEHFQGGVFADYFNLNQTHTNLGGLGIRASVIGYDRLKFEAEMAYDFGQPFTEGFRNNGTGVVSFQRTNVRVLHGLFGPRVNLGRHYFQPFLTAKGGAINARLDNAPATFGTFTSTVSNLRSNDVTAAFYAGTGVEGHLGPVGLRLDAGDEMFFQNGTHHNLRVTFGPVIRF